MLIASFYTNDYRIFYTKLVERLNELKIKHEIEKLQNIKFNKSKIYSNKFTGCDIKVQVVIDNIKKHFGSHILYVDITSFINELPTFDNNVDMMFALENMHKENNNVNNVGVNIGVIYINCNQRTLDFWTNVRNYINTYGLWDQGVVNYLLGVGRKLKSFEAHEKIMKNVVNPEHMTTPSWNVFDEKDVAINKKSKIIKVTGDFETKIKSFNRLRK